MQTIIIIAVIALIVLWIISIYNNMVRLRNNRENAFSNIDVQLKQRYDLVPQLVSTVKGYATHEKELLERITEARSACLSANSINDKISANNMLSNAPNGSTVSVEAYPDSKANQNFMDLQGQLKAVEEDIANSRKYYNAVVKQFNTKCEVFPSNLIAGIFHFEKKPMFEVEAQEERQNVKVSFS